MHSCFLIIYILVVQPSHLDDFNALNMPLHVDIFLSLCCLFNASRIKFKLLSLMCRGVLANWLQPISQASPPATSLTDSDASASQTFPTMCLCTCSSFSLCQDKPRASLPRNYLAFLRVFLKYDTLCETAFDPVPPYRQT